MESKEILERVLREEILWKKTLHFRGEIKIKDKEDLLFRCIPLYSTKCSSVYFQFKSSIHFQFNFNLGKLEQILFFNSSSTSYSNMNTHFFLYLFFIQTFLFPFIMFSRKKLQTNQLPCKCIPLVDLLRWKVNK